MRAHLLLLAVLAVTGCSGETINCENVPYETAAVRNPETGACEARQDGDCGICGPCPMPDDAACAGPCDALAEPDCITTPACRAAYAVATAGATTGAFLGCWGTAPSGPIHDGSCAGLDAWSCSRHDNCGAWYVQTGATRAFDHCADEISGTCDPATCTDPPPVCATGAVPATLHGCYTGACIPLGRCPPPGCDLLATEAACAARADCVPIYRGDQCTCTPTSCTCATETYERCEAAPDRRSPPCWSTASTSSAWAATAASPPACTP